MDTDSTDAGPEVYTVYARTTPFVLTHSQITFDSPNHFTTAFLSDSFTEASSRTLRTDRHPLLFALLVEHLSGHDVLPLRLDALPPTMTLETGLDNFLRDADFFGLTALERKLRRAGAKMRTEQSEAAAKEWAGEVIPFEEWEEGELYPEGTTFVLRDTSVTLTEDHVNSSEFMSTFFEFIYNAKELEHMSIPFSESITSVRVDGKLYSTTTTRGLLELDPPFHHGRAFAHSLFLRQVDEDMDSDIPGHAVTGLAVLYAKCSTQPGLMDEQIKEMS